LELAPFLLVCPLFAVHACPTGLPPRPTPSAEASITTPSPLQAGMVFQPLRCRWKVKARPWCSPTS
jgi:hypothetical protein